MILIREFFVALLLSAFAVFGTFLCGYIDPRIVGVWVFWIYIIYALFVHFVVWVLG